MNPKVKKSWVSALRSGQYKQSVYNLKTEKGFCCLGVLCDLYLQEVEEEWELEPSDSVDGGSHYSHISGYDTFLPPSIVKWAELPDYDPEVSDMLKPERLKMQLSQFNDCGYTFEQIATLIEEQL